MGCVCGGGGGGMGVKHINVGEKRKKENKKFLVTNITNFCRDEANPQSSYLAEQPRILY